VIRRIEWASRSWARPDACSTGRSRRPESIHPSPILRGEPERRESEFTAFVDDLRFAASLL
jgi:hypothetical protein